MISDELFLLSIGHGGKRVVFTLKVSIELGKSGGDELLDFFSLLWCNACSERIVSEVSGNSDSCGVDHLVLIWWEWWAFQMSVVHVGNVLVSWLVTVISLNADVIIRLRDC